MYKSSRTADIIKTVKMNKVVKFFLILGLTASCSSNITRESTESSGENLLQNWDPQPTVVTGMKAAGKL